MFTLGLAVPFIILRLKLPFTTIYLHTCFKFSYGRNIFLGLGVRVIQEKLQHVSLEYSCLLKCKQSMSVSKENNFFYSWFTSFIARLVPVTVSHLGFRLTQITGFLKSMHFIGSKARIQVQIPYSFCCVIPYLSSCRTVFLG